MKSASVCMMAAGALISAVVAGPSFAQDQYNDQHYNDSRGNDQHYNDSRGNDRRYNDSRDNDRRYNDSRDNGRYNDSRDNGRYNDPHYEAYAYYQHQCEVDKHNRNLAGIGIGAVVGGLLGNSLSHGGGRAGGTVLGAAAGAAVGSNVARSTIHCKDGRPYWSYEQTVEYRSYNGYPGRYDDDWYGRHHCRWVQSEHGWMRVCPGPNGYFYPAY